MELHLANSVVVVTGAASGIGRAVAEGFAAEGARVALWDRSPSVVEAANELAAAHGEKSIGCVVDVVRPGDIDDALRKTQSDLGPIDHLVHSAATGSGKFGFPFLNLTPDDWSRVLDVNIMGMTRIAHAIAPEMMQRRRGTMIFVASVAGQIGSQTDPPYSASKAANINFAQCLAKDLAPHGVRVNSVCPGMVQTPLNRAIWQAWHDQQPPESRKSYDDWAGEKVKSVVPLGQWQQPADIADMIVFLSSRRASHVTGQTINVDGGYVIR